MNRRETKAEQRRLAAAKATSKRPCIVAFELPEKFESQSSGPCALRLKWDNEAVVEWVSGRARVFDSRVQKRVGRMQLQLHRMLREGKIAPQAQALTAWLMLCANAANAQMSWQARPSLRSRLCVESRRKCYSSTRLSAAPRF